MKQKLLIAIAGTVVSGASFAQGSVQIYGVIDAAYTYVNNSGGGSLNALSAGPLKGNRIGFTGTEDLGGGLAAVFRLENGFSVLNGSLGQGNAMFGRQAYVGLSSKSAGTVTLGRQYDSMVDYVGVLKAGGDTAGAYANHPGDIDNTGNNYRVNNAIKYASPNYSGLSFGGVFSPGVAGNGRSKRIFSLGAGYNNGPLQLGLAFVNAQDPNFSYYGNNPNSSTTGNNMSTPPIFSGYASAGSLQTIGAAGAYNFGGWIAGVIYTNSQLKSLGSEAGLNPRGYSGNAVFNTVELNLRKFLTPSVLFGTSVQYTRANQVTGNAGGGSYVQANAGFDYFLSKRTDLYAVGMWQRANGYDSTGGRAVASIFGFTPSTTNTQMALAIGMRHAF